MNHSRRTALKMGATTLAGIGLTSILPSVGLSQDKMMAGHSYDTMGGKIIIHPVAHASFVMEAPGLVIYVDPVGEASSYDGLPPADLLLITHEHGDHYNGDTLTALAGSDTQLLTNPAVLGMLPAALKAKASAIGNGEGTTIGDIKIDAIPAYNTTDDRKKFHPEGRDNGYVLSIDGKRVYIAGDTEDVPEMRALKDIDIAFLPMNLPYTMDIDQAASAVSEFKPGIVYPYHYRGSDIDAFAAKVADGGSGSEVILHDWYA